MDRIWLSPAVLILGLLAGCGSYQSKNCSAIPIAINPASGTADHSAATPGDQVQFTAKYTNVPSGCSAPAALPQPSWSSSDTTNVQISSALDGTNGLATCIGTTSGPVTITATLGSGIYAETATAQLTCH